MRHSEYVQSRPQKQSRSSVDLCSNYGLKAPTTLEESTRWTVFECSGGADCSLLSVGAGHEGHMSLRAGGDAYVHVTYRCNILRMHAFKYHDSILMHWSDNRHVETRRADIGISRHIRLLRSHAVH